MSHDEPRLGIYYEHPDWYRPLFAELDRRAVPYDALQADAHSYDPSERVSPHAVVFNRMSPSAYIRGRGHLTFYTQQYLAHLERLGVRVVNGVEAWRTEISKALQLTILEELGVAYPKARIIHDPSQAWRGRGPSLPGCRESEHRRQRSRNRPLRFPGGAGERGRRGRDCTRDRQYRTGAGIRARRRRPDRPRRGAERHVSLCHPDLHHGGHVQPLPGRRVPGRRRRRA